MQVITIESETFKAMQEMVANILNVVSTQATELKQLKDNRLMDIHEVMEYTGFGKSWIMERKNEIGFIQVGSSPLRFRKDTVDAYLAKHFIQTKNK